MRFGCFGDMETLPTIQDAGYDYVELPVRLVKPEAQESEFEPFQEFLQSFDIVPEVWSDLLDDEMWVCGHEVDSYRIERYLRSAFHRLEELGAQIVVFQEKDTNVPKDFPREEALKQLSDFVATAATIAGQHGITLAVATSCEPDSLLLELEDTGALVKSVEHPFAQLLAQEHACPGPSDDISVAHAWADYNEDNPESEKRLAAFLSVLADRDYDERVTVRCPEDSFGDQCREALSFLKNQARKLRQQ